MKLIEFEQYFAGAKEILGADEDIEVAFCVRDENGKARHICFNIVTVYIENKLISFSIEGPAVEIWQTEVKKG